MFDINIKYNIFHQFVTCVCQRGSTLQKYLGLSVTELFLDFTSE